MAKVCVEVFEFDRRFGERKFRVVNYWMGCKRAFVCRLGNHIFLVFGHQGLRLRIFVLEKERMGLVSIMWTLNECGKGSCLVEA